MVKALASIATLLFGAAALTLGYNVLGIALPLDMHAMGLSRPTIGAVMSAFFAGLLLGSYFGAAIIVRVGHVRTFAGLAAAGAAAALLYPSLPSPFLWGVLRLVHGLCLGGLLAVIESWLNESSANALRGRILAYYMTVIYAAMALGQLLINAWPGGSHGPYMVATFLISVSLVPMALTPSQTSETPAAAQLSFRELYGFSPLGVVGSWAAGLVMGAFYGMGAVYARGIGLSILDVSLFTASVMIGGLVIQWPVGRLSDRYDRRAVLLGVLVVLPAVSLTMSLASTRGVAGPEFLLASAIFGGGICSIYPIALAQTFDHVRPGRFVAASRWLLLSYAVGAMIGPLLAALVMQAIGYRAFFGFVAAVAAGLALFVSLRIRWRRPVPTADQVAFYPVSHVAPVASELDPRRPENEENARGQTRA